MSNVILKKESVSWKPQEGPQELSIQCPAFELLMGGAVGGGKSDFLLGDFAADLELGSSWKGVYFRRHFPDMDDIIHRSMEIFGPVYGEKCYSGSKYQWNFPNGAILQFRALEKDTDVYKYQGQQYCLAKGSSIRMGDGSLLSIEMVKQGDSVMTLEGPKTVLETHGPFVKECVRADVRDENGVEVGFQIHPMDHKIMNSSGGWDSYASLKDAPSCDKGSFLKLQETSPHRRLTVPVVLHEPYLLSNTSNTGSSMESRSFCKSCGQSHVTSLDPSGQHSDHLRHHGQAEQLLDHNTSQKFAGDTSCVSSDLGIREDSGCDCLSSRCSRDEQPLSQPGVALCDPPSQDDAVGRIQTDCMMDEAGNALECNPCLSEYGHPYTGETRRINEGVSIGSCEMSPCGKHEVYDLTVESVAHYISGSSFLISKNSWVGWDELTQWPTAFPYTYLMTRIRSAKGVKRLRVRAATNPGGLGHAWVKARFVDPMQPGQGLKVRTKSGDHYWRVFIPSKLEDNRILMDNDPGYGDRVYEINDPILADALRNGRWDIVAGAAFPEFDPKVHVIDPIAPPVDKAVIRTLDWGYKEPYGGLWGFPHDGDLIIFNEIYGWSGMPNIGTEEDPAVVRQKIENYEAMNNLYVRKGLLDGQCWEQRGNAGGRLVDLLGGKYLGWRKWEKGPHSRVNQKQVLHSLLSVTNGDARIKITRNCQHLIRTLPILPSDPKNREDVDTTSEDHLYDAMRALANEKLPTREQIRMRAMRRRMESSGMDIDLPGGGF